ncbi:hypothetical protein T484DRAFT_3050134 [Baffinella frigidus]|nr:hypothetical protein T484DRAFT_3050134 [Cryptophyta sp. CCMP2293]
MPAAHQPDKVVDVIQAVFFPFQGYNPSAFRPLRSVPGCGSAPFQARQCINLHKLLVVPVYLGWIYAYGGTDPFAFTQKFAPAAIVLLVAHGLYGVLWVFKDVHFGDERWKAKMSPLGFLVVFTSLALYYLPMWCLVSRSCPGARFGEGYEPQLVGAGLLCYCLGCFYHFAADCQKHHVLAHRRPRSLITDGLFAHSRNPGPSTNKCFFSSPEICMKITTQMRRDVTFVW